MNRPLRSSLDARFSLFWIFAGLCEAPVIALILGWPMRLSAPLGVLLHMAASLLIFMSPPPEKGYFKPSRHWGQPLGLMTLLMPGVGWFLSGWLVFNNREAPYDKEAYLFEDEAPDDDLAARIEDRERVADALDVIPAVDALLSDVPGLKRGAIETLSKIQTSEAIGWIEKARTEKDPEVRFYATTALTRLKHEFETAARVAQKEVYLKPGELEPQIAYCRVRYEHALSGILDPDARISVLEECRDKLEALSGRTAFAARLLFLVQRELEPKSALAILDRLDAENPEERSRWTRERVGLLFSLGRFDEVRRLLRAYREDAVEEKESSPEERLWRTQRLWWSDE